MILNFRTQKQLLDNWCWAAITSSISFYYDPASPWIQSALASRLIDNVCSTINSNNAQVAPPVCNVAQDIARSLLLTGNFRGDIMRPLTFNEVVQQVNAGFPVCCQIVFPGFDTAHFVVIYGYEFSKVILGDPQAGLFSVEYSEFVNNYRGGRWRRTIGTRKNPLSTI